MAIVETSTPAPTERATTTGFILSMVAGILIIINGLINFVAGLTFIAAPVESAYSGIIYLVGGIWLLLCLLFGILVIIGAWLIYDGENVLGGVLVLTFGILSIFFGGGFFIGFILAIIGGVLGLAGK